MINRNFLRPKKTLHREGSFSRVNSDHNDRDQYLDWHQMKAELEKLIDDPNKLVQESRNEVARILRVFLREHRITNMVLNKQIREWTQAKTGGNSNSKHANDPGNFIKAITKPKISFERLITAMEILDPLSWSITIGVRWTAGPEKKLRFNYVKDPVRYENVTGQKPEAYLTPLIDNDEDDDIQNVK